MHTTTIKSVLTDKQKEYPLSMKNQDTEIVLTFTVSSWFFFFYVNTKQSVVRMKRVNIRTHGEIYRLKH